MLQEEPYSNHNSVDEHTERNIFWTKLVNVTVRGTFPATLGEGRGSGSALRGEGRKDIQSEAWRIQGKKMGDFCH